MGMKAEAAKWGLLAVAGLVLVTVIGFGMKFVNKRVDRAVLVTSHQYQEGMAERVAILSASLAEVDSRLSGNIASELRSSLEAQRSSINVQLMAARRN